MISKPPIICSSAVGLMKYYRIPPEEAPVEGALPQIMPDIKELKLAFPGLDFKRLK